MPVKFSDLIEENAPQIRNRRAVRRFYEEAKGAVQKGELNLEGHSLPTTMNAWIRLVEGEDKKLTKDYDVVDFSFADDEALKRWRAARLEAQESARGQKTVYLSESGKALLERVKGLEAAREESLLRGSSKKEDVVSALSDLQAAVFEFTATYDEVQGALRLPKRELELARVRVRQSKKA